MPSPSTAPKFQDVTPAERHELLGRGDVGRLAFTRHERVAIEPINYVTDGEWIFGRTDPGTTLTTVLHQPWCAFETDEVRGLFDSDSVVVKGTFFLLDPEAGSPDHTDRRSACCRNWYLAPSLQAIPRHGATSCSASSCTKSRGGRRSRDLTRSWLSARAGAVTGAHPALPDGR